MINFHLPFLLVPVSGHSCAIKRGAALRKAASYCRKCGKPDGLFTYMQEGREDATARPSLVGVGVLSLQMCGSGSDSTARKGLDWMLKNTNQPFNWKANNTSSNLYQHYYGVQAAMNRGGDVWKAYNRAFRDSTLGAQASDGSFAPTASRAGGLVNTNGAASTTRFTASASPR